MVIPAVGVEAARRVVLALLGPLANKTGKKLQDAVLGPKTERELASVYVATLREVAVEKLPDNATDYEIEHVTSICHHVLMDAEESHAFNARTDAARAELRRAASLI